MLHIFLTLEIFLGLILIVLHSAGSQGAGSGRILRASSPVPPAPALQPDFGRVPLFFIPNQGQVHDQALFYARASRYTLWMTREGLVFDSARKTDGAAGTESRDVARLVFLGAGRSVTVEAVEQAEHKVNYLIGNDTSKWRKDLPTSLAIAVDRKGAAYITGTTTSADFPKKNAFDATYNGNNDGFVIKIK
jgi:hypothetical protein